MLDCRNALSQEKLEAYITGLMHCIRREAPVREQFSDAEIVEILHYAADLFMEKPILLEFDLPPDGLVVLGDLHGNIYSLLRSFERHGLPPKTNYLLLGDYVDRGQHQLELILLLILMKLRWPNNMIMLRGNHECIGFMSDDYFHVVTHGEFFVKVCQNELASTLNMYFLFNQMFDVMPVAAVISGHFLCCHGGVSQWMTCLENIRNIPRPTYARRMKFLEGCLLADILWADPEPDTERAFAVSQRGCGYTFNRQGLAAVLEALHLTTLIRGHEMYANGTALNFGDESCVTVHTAPTTLFNCSKLIS
ncbi:unnamed protein product [Gongylonema pulchrum]|uniref:Serine/threonine-protein phosphatase n=1 Tax=Gongylonema pulchrum TaxID=637853 RepID=A0A183E5J9_9BILA|nr:unnamed protein product [Gongylonema pulchrum]